MAITPQDITTARNQAYMSGSTANSMMSSLGDVEKELKDALTNKFVQGNQLIEQKNQAQADYLSSGANARAMYADPNSESFIFDPYARDRLSANAEAQAYKRFANLSDVLGIQLGQLSDNINAGTNSYRALVQGAQSQADLDRQMYQDLLNEYKMFGGGGVNALDGYLQNNTIDPNDPMSILKMAAATGMSVSDIEKAYGMSGSSDLKLEEKKKGYEILKKRINEALSIVNRGGGLMKRSTGFHLFPRAFSRLIGTDSVHRQDLDAALAQINKELLFGTAGKALTETELNTLKGMIPQSGWSQSESSVRSKLLNLLSDINMQEETYGISDGNRSLIDNIYDGY